MYEVFINEHPIILTNRLTKETDFKLFLLDTFNVNDVASQLARGDIRAAHLYYPDEAQLMKKLKAKVPLVMAGGGVVLNPKNEVLFIFRNGKWDLPKGKMDKGETMEQAAVREVMEETGVKNLKIERFLCKTYHIFKRGDYRLKETHWYLMRTSYNGKLVAQENEGIHKVEWKNDEAVQDALGNSYQNIKIVIKSKDKIGLLKTHY